MASSRPSRGPTTGASGCRDDSYRTFEVADHAWRLYRHMGGDVEQLPESFVTALQMSAIDHMRMLEAVQPYIDTSISKTVNVPEDYPYEAFRNLYLEAWKAGLKGARHVSAEPGAWRGAVGHPGRHGHQRQRPPRWRGRSADAAVR
jgi:hypothetical protein